MQASTVVIPPTKIHLAHVSAWGERPKYIEVFAPESPHPEADEVQIRVNGAAIHKLVQLRGSGQHYSAKSLPHIPGVDGVGVGEDGESVYFFNFGESLGSFAEVVNVPKSNVFKIPPGIDQLQVAALVNPAMSSWMALRKRTVALPSKFNVLILGATSLSGTLAIPIARALGAERVIGVARDQQRLDNLDLDLSIQLEEPAVNTDFSNIGHVDVILDYVYGSPTAHLLNSLNPTRFVQYIEIGDLASPNLVLHSKILKGKKILISGSGFGSFSHDELREELPDLLKAIGGLPTQKLNVAPLSQIEQDWDTKPGQRTVFIP